jgi:hypothetical protein
MAGGGAGNCRKALGMFCGSVAERALLSEFHAAILNDLLEGFARRTPLGKDWSSLTCRHWRQQALIRARGMIEKAVLRFALQALFVYPSNVFQAQALFLGRQLMVAL